MTPDEIRLRLRSSTPGRQRWEAPAIRRELWLAQQVQAALAVQPGVMRAEANAIIGRILVLYDTAIFPGGVETLLRTTLADCLERPQPEAEAQPWLSDSPIFRVLKLAKSQPGLLTRAELWAAGAVLVGFLPTWGLSTLMSVSKATTSNDPNRPSIGFLGLLTALSSAAEWYIKHRQRQLWKEFASQVEHKLRSKAFAHVESLDMAFFDSRNTAQLQDILWGDISTVGRFLETGPSNAIQTVVTAALCLCTIAALSPSLALLVALPAGAVVLVARYFQRQITPLYEQFAEDSAELSRQLANCLSGMATIKSFTAEQREAERTRRTSDKRRISYSRAISASSKNASFLHATVYSTVSALTITAAATYVMRGSMSTRSFQTVTQLVWRFFAAISQLDDLYDTYLNAGSTAQRLLDVFDVRPTILDGERHPQLARVRGDIVFRNVSFSYRPGTEILRNINLEIHPGEIVGIVGATGAGKSTIAKVLLRFYDVEGGSVTIDGTDVKELPVKLLRQMTAFVAQDVYLFDGTVYENIAYGRPDATMEQLIEAARAAEAHDFIVQLPGGYQSPVGERGQRLSLGQRQRISIARAVIKDAPILVFDEATASVDNETEAAIQASIEKMAVGRSMIIIAHRLSAVRNSARIYVIGEGAVVEQGTHEALLASGGLYASLWNVQTGARARGA